MNSENELRERIRQAQYNDMELRSMESLSDFFRASDGVIMFKQRVCVPNDAVLKRMILDEAHKSKFTIHPRSTKMYQDLKKHFWWPDMKVDVADYMVRCAICQQVKIEHQRLGGMLQPLDVPI